MSEPRIGQENYNNSESPQKRQQEVTFSDYRINATGFTSTDNATDSGSNRKQPLPQGPYGQTDYSEMHATHTQTTPTTRPPGGNEQRRYDRFEQAYHEPMRGPPKQQQQYKPGLNILNHFGIYPSIPSLNILKIASIIVLIILVELNIIMNIESSQILYDLIGYTPNVLMGIGIIGIILGMLYRYFDFELEQQRIVNVKQQKNDFKSYLKMGVVLIIMIFIILEIFVELLVSRGFLFVIDITSITIMAIGTYAMLSGKRYLIILPVLFLFLIMLLGVDSAEPNFPLLMFLGILTIVYFELSDGAVRLQEYALKYHDMAKEFDMHAKTQVDHHINDLTVKFGNNLGIFIVFTLIIAGLLLMLYIAYPYLTPAFMSENLELKTAYAFLPIIFLLFFIFMIIYLFTPKFNEQNDSEYRNEIY